MDDLIKQFEKMDLMELNNQLNEAENVLKFLTENKLNPPHRRFMRSKIKLIQKRISDFGK